MAAQKTVDRGTQYAVIDSHGNKVSMKQGATSFVGGAPTVDITVGGSILTLTKQNIIDLLPAWTGFSNTGVLS